MIEIMSVLTPDLGCAEPVRVSAWLVEVGETVREGDRLVELLLPGVTYDVAAPATGRLVEVRSPLNATVATGNVLGEIEVDDDV
jgi:pyruvate/2-oxoglutarate dehydrogenase complex dihydrolipoamide acyltransferase (E2) component